MREREQETIIMFTIALKLNIIITTSSEVQDGNEHVHSLWTYHVVIIPKSFFKQKILLHFFVGFQSILDRFLSSFVITQAILAAPFC